MPKTPNLKPVVALDIDGTLGDYHTWFLRFAQDWYGRPMPNPRDINPGMPLHKFMGTSKSTYRACKLAYRQGGLERSMPAYAGAHLLTRTLRQAGVELWLCTTRPYLKMDTQSPNTVHWLRRNQIQYDYMISGPHKYRDLVKSVGAQRIVCVMDDLPEMYDQARELDLKALLRDQPYNRHYTDAWRIDKLLSGLADIQWLLNKWKGNHGNELKSR